MLVVPVFLRWLLPIVTAIALLGTTMTAFAAAGFVGESECCCPDPDACKCHDHDKDPVPDTTMKKCGGEAKMVSPTVIVAMMPEPVTLTATTTSTVVEHESAPRPPDRVTRPEKPPF